MKNLVQPDNIVWIDGSKDQIEKLREQACKTGELIKLNQEKLPGCYLHRSAENDVARVEDRTFICSKILMTPDQQTIGKILLKHIIYYTTSQKAVIKEKLCTLYHILWDL